MKHILFGAFFLFSLTSCNLYSPFQGSGGDVGLIEEARKALNDGDFSKALELINQIGDSTTKSRQLCTFYLFKAGLGLSQMLNAAQTNPGMLQALANQLVPWDSTKQSDAESAFSNCTTYKNATTGTNSQNEGILMRALGGFVDCAMRLAKTDKVNQVDTNGTCDNTPSHADADNGSINRLDISPSAAGTIIGGGQQGMCNDDADACRNNLQTINAELVAAGLDSYDNIPAGLGGGGSNPVAARLAVRADFQSFFDEDYDEDEDNE